MTGVTLSRDELVNAGVDQLSRLLGSGWHVSAEDQRLVLHSPLGERAERHLLAYQTVQPRFVRDTVVPLQSLYPETVSAVMVLAPTLTSRTRDALRDAGIDYLDLNGNTRLRVSKPAIVIETSAPAPKVRSTGARTDSVTLAGSKAARLVRLLTDFAPPYRSSSLAAASGLSPAYVSRLLKLLDEQLIVHRDLQVVTAVDWPGLLRSRSDAYTLLRHNPALPTLAPNGVSDVLSSLSRLNVSWAITGHYAARQVAPLASGGQLMVYLPADAALDAVADDLGLLQVGDNSADVMLLPAHDPVVFERTRQVGAERHVALSQLVLDSLSGPGRMPAEGEAVLEHMIKTEASWRSGSLPARQTE